MTTRPDTGKIKSLIIKKIQQAFISDDRIEQHGKELNYPGNLHLRKQLQSTHHKPLFTGKSTSTEPIPPRRFN